MEKYMNQNSGVFVISLDFELLWGVFDKIELNEKRSYFERTREIIPDILKLFKKYEIHATWAIVGMLFNRDWSEWDANIPERKPYYANGKLNPYNYGESINSMQIEQLCFAPELVNQIKNTPNQEIGTHTYSHYYCKEDGQTIETFRSDLVKAVQLAKDFDIELKSLVFPRNQYNEEYLRVCTELGIRNIRSNPDFWYWENTEKDSIKLKLFRTGDAYIGRNNKSYKGLSENFEGDLIPQKASRLLRPYSGKRILEKLKIRRIKKEITKAAKNGEIYHLWWHPHNFADNPSESLNQLEEILVHFKLCNSKYGFKSLNMEEFGQLCSNKNL